MLTNLPTLSTSQIKKYTSHFPFPLNCSFQTQRQNNYSTKKKLCFRNKLQYFYFDKIIIAQKKIYVSETNYNIFISNMSYIY